MDLIDLRSDTVTRPSRGMREAMAAAEVGDDQFGEDPTVNLLQERIAGLLGKAAALWVPTGTMANQVALRVLTRPGDDVIVARGSHVMWHETGAAGANAGVQFSEVGAAGVFTLDDFLASSKPQGHMIYPPTTLVTIENTHNRAGGVVFPPSQASAICGAARERGVASYLDGARLFNAAVAAGRSPRELAAPFDLAAIALSKGLGAPGGSVLAGTREVIGSAVRYRRMSGGAMRQVGIFAAAGLYALEHNLDRLAEDHANARRIADIVAEGRFVVLDPASVRTNILVFHLAEDGPDAATVVERARQEGVLVLAFGPSTIRAVTHLDVSASECERAAAVLVAAADVPAAQPLSEPASSPRTK
jgi:threonine aldolase